MPSSFSIERHRPIFRPSRHRALPNPDPEEFEAEVALYRTLQALPSPDDVEAAADAVLNGLREGEIVPCARTCGRPTALARRALRAARRFQDGEP